MGFGGRLPVAPVLGCSLSVAMDPMAGPGADPVGSNSVAETCNWLSRMVEMGSEKWNENWVSCKIGSRGHWELCWWCCFCCMIEKKGWAIWTPKRTIKYAMLEFLKLKNLAWLEEQPRMLRHGKLLACRWNRPTFFFWAAFDRFDAVHTQSNHSLPVKPKFVLSQQN